MAAPRVFVALLLCVCAINVRLAHSSSAGLQGDTQPATLERSHKTRARQLLRAAAGARKKPVAAPPAMPDGDATPKPQVVTTSSAGGSDVFTANSSTVDCQCDGVDYSPVCGDDYVTYSSLCKARCNYADAIARGPCTRAVICNDACNTRVGLPPLNGMSSLCGATCPFPLLPGKASTNCPDKYRVVCNRECLQMAVALVKTNGGRVQTYYDYCRSQCLYARCGLWG